MRFELGLRLAQVQLCTKLREDTSNISSDIFLITFVTLKTKIKVMRIELGICLALVLLCTKFGRDTSIISSDIEQKQF